MSIHEGHNTYHYTYQWKLEYLYFVKNVFKELFFPTSNSFWEKKKTNFEIFSCIVITDSSVFRGKSEKKSYSKTN